MTGIFIATIGLAIIYGIMINNNSKRQKVRVKKDENNEQRRNSRRDNGRE